MELDDRRGGEELRLKDFLHYSLSSHENEGSEFHNLKEIIYGLAQSTTVLAE